MANGGHDQMPVMMFFDLISGIAFFSLRAMLRNAIGMLVFWAWSMTMNAACLALNPYEKCIDAMWRSSTFTDLVSKN